VFFKSNFSYSNSKSSYSDLLEDIESGLIESIFFYPRQREIDVLYKNGDKFKTKYLICSTNLLLHKRSLKILNINQIPLRKAIPKNKDKKIDLLLNFLDKQSFIPRLTFLIYTNENYSYKDFYSKKYRYFYLETSLENNYKFERVIFQLQENNKLGIVVHTKNIDLFNSYIGANDEDFLKKIIFKNFNNLFIF